MKTVHKPDEFVRLYYFTSLEFGISNVQKQRIKISRLLELNDPFEFRNVISPSTSSRFPGEFECWLTGQNDSKGIICFSKKCSSPLMWGHYADKSKGMVLAFDVLKDDLFDVKYHSDLLRTPSLPIEPDFACDLVASKAKAWCYEKECRVFISLITAQAEMQAGTGKLLFFEKFSNSMALKEILIGPDCSADRATVNTLKRYAGLLIPIFSTKRASNKFEIKKSEKL